MLFTLDNWISYNSPINSELHRHYFQTLLIVEDLMAPILRYGINEKLTNLAQIVQVLYTLMRRRQVKLLTFT
jgi:hypothetical protein